MGRVLHEMKVNISDLIDRITQRRKVPTQVPLNASTQTQGAQIAVRDMSVAVAIQEGLKRCDTVYACCRLLADAMASVPYRVEKYIASSDTWQKVKYTHSLQRLLDKPNPYIGTAEMNETAAYDFNLAGNVFINVITVDKMPIELWVLNPEYVDVDYNKVEFIKAYNYRINGRNQFITPDEVVHARLVDPANPVWGLAPIVAAARIIDTEMAAINWNREAMENRAGADLLISPKGDDVLNKKQYEEFRESVMTGLAGSGNARKVIATNGAVEVKVLNFSALEMDFIKSLDNYKSRICSTFKTPAPLITFDQTGGSMSNNLSPLFRFYWEQTVIPIMARMVESLNQTLLPFYPSENLRIVADYSNVKAMQVNNLDDMKIAIGYAQAGVPMDEIIKSLHLNFPLGMEMTTPVANPANVDRLHPIEDNTQTGMSNQGSGSVPVDGVVQ